MARLSGVYKIVNSATGQVYIGSSANIPSRWSHHRRSLQSGGHDNSFLQNAWNKYGEGSFTFSVIEEVSDTTELIEREQHYIDSTGCTDRSVGYNLCPVAGRTKGLRYTPERRARMSAAMVGNSYALGFKHTAATCKRVSDGLRGKLTGEGNSQAKLTVQLVEQIRCLYDTIDISQSTLSKQFGVSRPEISMIVTNKHWKDPTYTPGRVHRRGVTNDN